MALPSRYGSAMLSRGTAIPSSISSSILTQASRRAFSTRPALPFRASTRSHKDDPSNGSPSDAASRLNPLIADNYALPPKPAPRPTAVDDFIPPPPPPPPRLQTRPSTTSPTNAPREENNLTPSNFKYNAADPTSDPFRNLDLSDLISDKATTYGRALGMSDPLSRPKVRTKAVTGRTVFIADRLTPTTAPTPVVAIRVLERMCREQKVRNKFHSQKFHERKGLKRKRLRSERWRARFKVGFKAAVSKVLELKKQGW